MFFEILNLFCKVGAFIVSGSIVFFGMLVTATVRAGNDERMRLEQATHAVEGAAGSAKIDLRPCYGAQDTTFAASLPLGLNLRNYTPPSAFAALS